MNDFCNKSRPCLENLVAPIPPAFIAEKFVICDPGQAYQWGYLLGRLAFGGEEWRETIAQALDVQKIEEGVKGFAPSQLFPVSTLISSLASYDLKLAQNCIEAAMSNFQRAFEKGPFCAYQDLAPLESHVLGHCLLFPKRPSKRQKQLMKEIFKVIDSERLAMQIVGSRFGDWEVHARLLGWVKIILPRKLDSIIQKLSFDNLDR